MKFVLALAAAAAILPEAALSNPGLDEFRWRSRLLVVVAPEPGDPRLARQKRLFEAAGRGVRDRDLVWIEGVGRAPRAEELRRRFGVPAGEFRALLVGKDGGAKLSSAEPIAVERLFGEIDAMPMRRDEMRRRGGTER